MSALMLILNINTIRTNDWFSTDWQSAAILLGIAILPFIVGRAFLYIVAGR
ncbi:hypothetical protein PH562_16755 [Rhizobium sp. CNPSo 4062]|uniref:hypothetical protein n=1 Tax=Rhizobium sp. CNPSo 4062 TaxID=3021410 RepID=UPI00254D2849|nr:hypothetical protein [Rhizobium sp. CNPSo 4062]MDK4703903.1 hypothetical protein [Rhizobium sp. CNPSo 4062]